MSGAAKRVVGVLAATMALVGTAVLPAVPPAGADSLTVGCAADGAVRAAALIDAVDAANTSAGADTITLAAGCVYTFTAPNQMGATDPTRFNWYGPNALPAIASAITIEGNGATIERSPADGTPMFRLLYVGADPTRPSTADYASPGAGELTLRNLTLGRGLAKGGDSGAGGGGAGLGGAVFNQGLLTLDGVTLTANTAQGGSAGVTGAQGGGGIGTDAVGDVGGGFGPGTFGGAAGGAGSLQVLSSEDARTAGGGGGGFRLQDEGGDAVAGTPGNGGGPETGTGGGGGHELGGASGNGSGGGGAVSYNLPYGPDGGDGGGFGQGGQPGGPIVFGDSSGGGGGGVGGGGGGRHLAAAAAAAGSVAVEAGAGTSAGAATVASAGAVAPPTASAGSAAGGASTPTFRPRVAAAPAWEERCSTTRGSWLSPTAHFRATPPSAAPGLTPGPVSAGRSSTSTATCRSPAPPWRRTWPRRRGRGLQPGVRRRRDQGGHGDAGQLDPGRQRRRGDRPRLRQAVERRRHRLWDRSDQPGHGHGDGRRPRRGRELGDGRRRHHHRGAGHLRSPAPAAGRPRGPHRDPGATGVESGGRPGPICGAEPGSAGRAPAGRRHRGRQRGRAATAPTSVPTSCGRRP